MPQANEQQASPLMWIIILVIGFMAFRGGCQPAGPDKPSKPDPDVVEPDRPAKPSEEDVWNALASAVESKWIGGELQQHTDHLVKVVDMLKQSGSLTDTSRIDSWRQSRREITSENRLIIAAQLRGQ